jgi:hypothetical protein
MTRLLIGFMLLLSGMNSFAQHAYFATKGSIQYEKVVYTKARMRDIMAKYGGNNRGMMYMGNIDEMPESSTSNFVLQFDENQTVMSPSDTSTPVKSTMTAPGITKGSRSSGGGSRGGAGAGGSQRNNNGGNRMGGMMRGNNKMGEKIYVQNLRSRTSEIQLQIDEKILIKDSLQQVTWRFTDEFRTIAGYECRRVNGATKDSLYLIAFYSEEIPISAGPVLTNGLPGMILGLVIPEMHINYWATEVKFTNDEISNSWRDKKAKEMTANDFFKLLSGSIFRGRGGNESEQRRQILEQIIY